MGYYMGDYYAGMRGDPGLGSFFGKVLSVGKNLLGLAPIPGAGLISKIGKVAATGGAVVKAGKGIIMKHPVITAAGAAGAAVLAGAEGERLIGGHRKCKHINPRTGKCRRRMNPCNVHALRRASTRAHAFLRISRKLVGYYQPRKPKGRAFIKHRRKAK
jgi:hypothetical protein